MRRIVGVSLAAAEGAAEAGVDDVADEDDAGNRTGGVEVAKVTQLRHCRLLSERGKKQPNGSERYFQLRKPSR